MPIPSVPAGSFPLGRLAGHVRPSPAAVVVLVIAHGMGDRSRRTASTAFRV